MNFANRELFINKILTASKRITDAYTQSFTLQTQRDAAEIIVENNEKGCCCTTILKTFCIFAMNDTK